MKKYIIYPENLNMERLLENYNLSPTRKKNITLKSIKLVSRLFINNYNRHNFNELGYTTIGSKYKKKLLNNDYNFVHELLTTGPDPIIEIEKSYKLVNLPNYIDLK